MVARSGKPSVLAGLTADAPTGAWHCVNCWKCIDVCPRDIDIYSLMMARRRQEDMPELIGKSVENITRTGCSIKVKGLNQIREMYGLKPFRMIKEKKVKILLENESTMNGKTEKID
jgi:heterodisulfide reductase subunit C